ncbi:MAG: hypothetical protein DME08_03045, partial [Candidatus Rokuibacteriota bacterium]
KVNAIIREEMNAIGGQEITMPVMHPAEIWKQSGRWDNIPEMFKLKDRKGADMCLGMTHEEVVAWLAAREIRSYRDLPQIWYQIQTKERDEARPRSGVLRTREFLMKDSYTLDPDLAALDRSYAAHESAYRKIFERCGLRFHVVQSDTGMMGGLGSHEFMAPSAAGEDEIALCAGCDYAANVELARDVPAAPVFPAGSREEVATPNARTIAEVADFLKIDPRLTIKSLVYVATSGPVLVLVRGDHTIHERKLARALGEEFRAAHPDEVRGALRGVPSPRRRPGPGFRRAVRGSSHGTGGRSVPAVRQAARRGTGDRDRQHLQAGHQVLGAARRHVSRRERSAEADHHGQLRHRPRPHRRRGRRAAGRYRWYCLAGRHRPVPRAYRRGQREGPDAGEGRRVALRPVPGAGARTVARRPRRAAGREVQGRGPARYADPRDDRQRLREGRYRGGPGAALAGRAEGDSAGGNRRDQGAFELALNLPPPGSRAKVLKNWALPSFLL